MKLKYLLLPVLAGGILSAGGKKAQVPLPAAAPIATNATSPSSPAATANLGFEKLKSQWLRPDGGYLLEIRGAPAEGRLEAGSFNHRPINVAKAEASRDGEIFKVFIELRDVNYPGSTYTLIYDSATDRLVGNYFQAAMGQNFDVEFVRQQ